MLALEKSQSSSTLRREISASSAGVVALSLAAVHVMSLCLADCNRCLAVVWLAVSGNEKALSGACRRQQRRTAGKANKLFWIDNKGNAYCGGSLSAGVLRNAVQTGTTQPVGTKLLNGPCRTNGGNRTVTLSFARTQRRQRSQQGSTGFVAGAGANTAQVQLFRQIGSGGWVPWQTLNVTGSVSISNETDGPDIADSGWGGSFTVNDSSTAQETVSYLARIVAFGEQNVTHQAGNFDSQTVTQNLSIISVEQ